MFLRVRECVCIVYISWKHYCDFPTTTHTNTFRNTCVLMYSAPANGCHGTHVTNTLALGRILTISSADSYTLSYIYMYILLKPLTLKTPAEINLPFTASD